MVSHSVSHTLNFGKQAVGALSWKAVSFSDILINAAGVCGVIWFETLYTALLSHHSAETCY